MPHAICYTRLRYYCCATKISYFAPYDVYFLRATHHDLETPTWERFSKDLAPNESYLLIY